MGIASVIKSAPNSGRVVKPNGFSSGSSSIVSGEGCTVVPVSLDVSNAFVSVVRNSVNNLLSGYLSWYWLYNSFIKSSSLYSKKFLLSSRAISKGVGIFILYIIVIMILIL